MRMFWSKLAVVLGKRAGLVALIGLVLTVALGLGATRLEFATGQDTYLNADEQVAKDNVAYQSLFGGQIMLVMFNLDEGTSLVDLTTGENAEIFEAVSEELCGEMVDDHCTANPVIKSVITPLTALELADNLIQRDFENPSEVAELPTQSIAGTALSEALADSEEGSDIWAARLVDQNRTACRLLGLDGNPLLVTPEELAETCEESGFAAEEGGVTLDPALTTLDNPEWVDFLLHDNSGSIRRSLTTFFPDEGHAVMIVRLVGNASIEIEGEGATAVQEAWADRDIDGVEITVTGSPTLLKEMNDYLSGGLVQLGALAVVLMAVLLVFLFKVRWRLLSLGVVLLGTLWTFGLAGYVGIPLSVVTIAGLPVLLGMGIDYAIQVHSRVEEEVVIDRAEHPIQETAREMGPGLLTVTAVAILAFVSLMVARVPMIRSFGVLLAIGIAVVLITSIVVPVSALGFREYRSPTVGKDYREGKLSRIVVFLGSIPKAFAVPFVVISGFIFVGGLLVEPKLELQTDVVQWVNQDSESRKAIGHLYDELDISTELGTYVLASDTDELFSDENIAWIHDYTERQLQQFPEQLARASSIVTPLSYLLEVPGAPETAIAPTGDQIRKVFEVAPPEIRAFLISNTDDAAALNVLHTTRPGDLSQLADVVDDIRESADPPGDVRATPSGLAVVGAGLLRNLESGRSEITYLALGAAFLFLAIRFRSVIRGVMCLVPLLIATGASSIAAFALDLKLSPMTAVGGPIVIAACAEFTTLILTRFLEERRRGLTPKAASDVAASRTGGAFMLSALTTVVGIGVIATSSLPILRDFGIVVATNVIVALLSALVVLPPILIWADERRWVSRGLVPDDVLDRATLTHDVREPHTEDLGEAGPRPTLG